MIYHHEMICISSFVNASPHNRVLDANTCLAGRKASEK
jgi:hypothetical protein